MRKSAVAALMVAGVLGFGGCAQNPDGTGNKRVVGAMTGAAVGGLLGSHMGRGGGRLVATAMGVFVGGLIGHEIGRSLDEADRARAQQAMSRAQAAPIGETIEWNNPKSGHSGTYTPVRDGTSSSGNYCREFQQTVTIGGKTERAYGTACRQPDGSWQVVGS